jgi:hypothetical protein
MMMGKSRSLKGQKIRFVWGINLKLINYFVDNFIFYMLIWGLGFGVWGLGFGVWGLGFGV